MESTYCRHGAGIDMDIVTDRNVDNVMDLASNMDMNSKMDVE
jgi:hypothetical protein